MNPIIQSLLATGPVVIDGAWGTELQALGLPVGHCPETWNLAEPGKITAVARAYIESGSAVILTNTFGANRVNLARHGLAEDTIRLNQAGVERSRRAAGQRALVFASMGPSGKMLMSGETSEDELRAAFTEQAQALAAAGADGIVIETMTDLEEAAIAIRAAKATGRPVVASMAFDTGKDKDRTMMGVTPEQAADALAAAGADVIGANCGQGIEGYLPICKRLRVATDRPLWIKPNAGLPTISEGRTVYTTTAEQFVRFVPDLVRAGANFLGGCCGTRPGFIRAIREAVGG